MLRYNSSFLNGRLDAIIFASWFYSIVRVGGFKSFPLKIAKVICI